MKNLISCICIFALIFSVAVPACAEDARPYVEEVGDIIRLRNDCSQQDDIDDLMELRVVLAVEDLDLVRRQGPIWTTYESIYIAEMMLYDDDFAQRYYHTYAYNPFVFMRLAFTVENKGQKPVTIPQGKDYAWIVTDTGEIVKSMIGSRSSGEPVPDRLEPGEKATAYLFFYCYDTFAEYLRFFSLYPAKPVLDDGSRYGVPFGLCFELMETAFDQAEQAP